MKYQDILLTEKQVLEAKFARTQSKLGELKCKLKAEKSSSARNDCLSSQKTSTTKQSNKSDENKQSKGFFSPNKVTGFY